MYGAINYKRFHKTKIWYYYIYNKLYFFIEHYISFTSEGKQTQLLYLNSITVSTLGILIIQYKQLLIGSYPGLIFEQNTFNTLSAAKLDHNNEQL